MFFRPSFCAHCGEKIERPEWFPWTSRRFCQVCETEFKGQDLIPRFIVLVSILIGLFGFGSYLNSGSSDAGLQALKQPRKVVEQPAQVAKSTAPSSPAATPENALPEVNGQQSPRNISSQSGVPISAQVPRPRVEQAEPTYYCGAETRKGTPCSRRVKGNTRCFQHAGMPTMASTEKLSVK